MEEGSLELSLTAELALSLGGYILALGGFLGPASARPPSSLPQCLEPLLFRTPLLLCFLIAETVLVRSLLRLTSSGKPSLRRRLCQWLGFLRHLFVLLLTASLFAIANLYASSAYLRGPVMGHSPRTSNALDLPFLAKKGSESSRSEAPLSLIPDLTPSLSDDSLFWSVIGTFVRSGQALMAIAWLEHWTGRLGKAFRLFRRPVALDADWHPEGVAAGG